MLKKNPIMRHITVFSSVRFPIFRMMKLEAGRIFLLFAVVVDIVVVAALAVVVVVVVMVS